MQVHCETLIAAPPETVFEVLSDIPRWPDSIPNIEKVEMLTSGPVNIGTRFRETRKMHGRSATEEMTVTRYEPPRRFALSAENHGARYLATQEVIQVNGKSRLVLTFGATPLTLAARLFAILGFAFAGSIRRQLQRDLEHVKAEAERRAAAHGT
jgi:uncharacterized protein YndB with AHSA1/START domain